MKLDQIERKLTGGEKRSKEAHYKKLKKHKGDFIDRYGKEDGEAIMHAIATNRAKGESITIESLAGILMERKVKGKLLCPEVCCGAPVMECTCGPSCEHCNCHEIQRLAKMVGVDEGYKKKKKKKKTEGKGFNKMVITPHQNLPSTNTPFGGTTMVGKGFRDLQKAQAKTQTAVDQRQGAGMSRIGVFKNIDRTDFSPNVFPTRTTPKKPRPMTQSKASKGKALEAWLEENKMYGVMTEAEFDEAAGKKDACYYKVKSRYKVWPSAYASGALVQCRKKGAKNWGNKSKKK